MHCKDFEPGHPTVQIVPCQDMAMLSIDFFVTHQVASKSDRHSILHERRVLFGTKTQAN